MIDIQREIENQNLHSRMLLQVHDELVFDIEKTEKETLILIVKEKMEQAHRTRCSFGCRNRGW